MGGFDATEDAAQFLASLRRLRLRGDALPVASRPPDYAAAMDVQDRVVALTGAPVAGWKIGCTSKAAQEYLGIDHPFPGRVLADGLFDSPARLLDADFTQRGLECEFALMLGHDLPPSGEPHTRRSVAFAVSAVVPAIEVIESRYRDWQRVGLPSVIADNAGHGVLVRGAPRPGFPASHLDRVRATLTINGQVAAEGSGAAVLGHPLTALAWLANEVNDRGDMLRAGQIITTGTCTPYVEAPAGAEAVADFGELGRVLLRFG
ncbi:MAG: fumarylacetoacetate hydrolase family protein [Hyphomicrobiales bacterium]|nr:fumarylacetoacetate hydrolase family protein [Hyphomicrobiales bacterium]MCP5371791.1 fumarylacetoacetate hydrolase family protein [Hyphomicrobiales bacterium]